MALILGYLSEFGSFRGTLLKSAWLAINTFSSEKCHNTPTKHDGRAVLFAVAELLVVMTDWFIVFVVSVKLAMELLLILCYLQSLTILCSSFSVHWFSNSSNACCVLFQIWFVWTRRTASCNSQWELTWSSWSVSHWHHALSSYLPLNIFLQIWRIVKS